MLRVVKLHMLNRNQTLKVNKLHALPNRSAPTFLLLLFITLVIVNPQLNAAENISAVGQLRLINPETGVSSSCSATLVGPSRVATVASCVLSEETGRHARAAEVCFRINGQRSCYSSAQILTHSNYLSSQGVTDAHNLAYIDLKQPVTGIRPIKEYSPQQFEKLLQDGLGDLQTLWVGYDSRGISSRLPIQKSHLQLSGLEYDYVHSRLNLETAAILPGQHYEGTAVLIEDGGERYLLGMISSTFPDEIVHYYPEINPCDEDPVIVRYPKPIMLSTTQITAYPVAACGMNGFQSVPGYSELKCARMARRTSLANSIDVDNPIAMRQQALEYTAAEDTTDRIIDIYQLLNKAIQAGDNKAAVILARLLLEGDVFPKDTQTAGDLLQPLNSAEAHWLQAQQQLQAYSEHDMRSINASLDQQLYTHLSKASEFGISKAQYFLGRLYQFGIGTEQDVRKAYQWYARSAMQGEPSAQFQLGTMWVDGRGVRSYPQVGHYWIRQAAARGYIRAQNYLALNRQQSIDDALDEYEFEYSDTE